MNKSTVLLLVSVGLAYFLVKLLITVPAPLVIGQLSNSIPQFNAQGVQGTIWNGSAANISVTVDGKNQHLGKTSWQLSKLPLLWGSASLAVSAQHEKQSLDANAVVSMMGSIEIKDSDFSVPAEKLREFAPIPAEIGGQLSLRINHVDLSENTIENLDGVVTWQDAEINLTGAPAVLGSYVAKLSTDPQGGYMADVSELGGGALGIVGIAKYEPQQKNISVNADIQPTEKLDSGLRNMIMQLGQADAKGVIKFKYEGKI